MPLLSILPRTAGEPATVVTMTSAEISRRVALAVSATMTRASANVSSALGWLNRAAAPSPSAEPAEPSVPATSETRPEGVTSLTVLVWASPTTRLPTRSMAIDVGKGSNAGATDSVTGLPMEVPPADVVTKRYWRWSRPAPTLMIASAISRVPAYSLPSVRLVQVKPPSVETCHWMAPLTDPASSRAVCPTVTVACAARRAMTVSTRGCAGRRTVGVGGHDREGPAVGDRGEIEDAAGGARQVRPVLAPLVGGRLVAEHRHKKRHRAPRGDGLAGRLGEKDRSVRDCGAGGEQGEHRANARRGRSGVPRAHR